MREMDTVSGSFMGMEVVLMTVASLAKSGSVPIVQLQMGGLVRC